ncbi:unnamed protein product [Schistosoma margrebowiei]|uniref:Uncharacterized protein n=1 Tax=Schistosoma margrebowiei TaxID=48269 RepID=A0A183MQ54_9TREM|nr:unnamed protein product [Schistosoma margrebowiei]
MKTSTSEGKHGIQWTSRMQLDDLDFSDDLASYRNHNNNCRRIRPGRYDADVKARIGKARAADIQLKNIWNSKRLSTNTKV